MTDLAGRLAALTPEQRAQLAGRLAAGSQASSSIAIIGVGCRFPGAASPEAFWNNLMQGVDAVREVPSDRWDADRYYAADTQAPGSINSRYGGFLAEIDQFDRSFFGLSPREAGRMDPQQRLLLEVAWEALEDAGQMTPRLAGSATGVFIGAQSHSSDYYLLQAHDRDTLDTYTLTGTAHSILANRISFLLDLRGPSLAIDTACSSSLVAVHMACQSLKAGESDLALAGGVNLMLAPDISICLGKLEMLAPDGRCKTFDHRANGFVRGEGCGVVVLRRLADATRDRDPILAVIRGSAVNQDGASNGLTAPNGLAQEAVIRQALKAAQLSPGAVSYVETHGTGTILGDPIEVEAIANVLRPGNEPGDPCVLGAVKTNIGHLEAASGIAGLIKVALSLKHEAIPPNLHLESINPHLAHCAAAIDLPTEARRWPRGDKLRAAGVSSFGFGGTNAHAVLSEAPLVAVEAAPVRGSAVMAYPISARSGDALRQLAEAHIAFLVCARGEGATPADLSYTAARRRLHHDFRLCAVGADTAEWASSLRRQLDNMAGQSPPPREDDRGGVRSMLAAAAALYMRGAAVDWTKLSPGEGRCVQLPRYPWRRERCWLPRTAKADSATGIAGSRAEQTLGEAPPDWFYELRWRPRSRLGAEGKLNAALAGVDLPATARILRSGAETSSAGKSDDAALGRILDSLSAHYIWSALGELGARRSIGAAWPKEGLGSALRIQPRYERLLSRMMEILAGAAILRDQEENWIVDAEPARGIDGAAASAFPGGADVALLQARCGARLASVLRGETDPLPLLFAGGAAGSAEAIYRDIPPSQRSNRTLAEAVRAWLADVPHDRTMRILEVGAGVGATTAELLPVLPADRCEYVFTDVSPAFLRRTAERFVGHGFVRFETLDLELPPSEQGFGPGQFDLIVAANVLHATQDIGRSLGHVADLLADGGVLALVECTRSHPWMDVTFGLTDGWWRFTDLELRKNGPLLAEASWGDLLVRCGYGDVSAVPLQGPAGDPILEQSLLFARKGRAAQRGESRASRSGEAADPGRCLVIDDGSGLGQALLAELKGRGADPVLLAPEAWDVAAREWRGQTSAIADGSCETVIYLAAAGNPDLVGATERLLGIVRALMRGSVAPRKGLWLVTRGGQAIDGAATTRALSQSLVWGLGRGAALEAPELQPRLIDLDPAVAPRAAVLALLEEIAFPDVEDQIVLRRDGRYAPRLERIGAPHPGAPLLVAGRHLITGGLGGLGSLLAIELARAGASELVLLVNRPLPERGEWEAQAPGSEMAERIETVRALESLGAQVIVAPIDLADKDALSALFQSSAMTGARLRGVWHAAMSFSAQPIADLGEAAVRSMIRVKAEAALRLHDLTRDQPIEQFVLFSSTTALWGASGLAHYAAANACLDALAHLRRSQGLPATVINWGVWSKMRSLSAGLHEQARDVGLRPMPAAAALAALTQVLASDAAQTIVADVDWSRFKPAYEARRVRPMLSGLCAGVTEPGHDQVGNADQTLPGRLATAAPQQRRELLRSFIRQEVAIILGLEAESLPDLRTGFFELGMDSLTSLQLRRRLEGALGRQLPTTVAFKYPTIESMASYLSEDPASADEISFGSPAPEIRQSPSPQTQSHAASMTAEEADETEDELFDRLAARLSRRRA